MVNKVSVKLTGPRFGNYTIATIRGAVTLKPKHSFSASPPIRCGDLVNEDTARSLALEYDVTVVAIKGGN